MRGVEGAAPYKIDMSCTVACITVENGGSKRPPYKLRSGSEISAEAIPCSNETISTMLRGARCIGISAEAIPCRNKTISRKYVRGENMMGLGTIANVAAIIVGGGIGMLLKGGMKEQYQQSLQKAMGLCTIFIGASGALTGMIYIDGGSLAVINTLPMIIAMVIGTVIGEFCDFDGKMETLGHYLKEKASASGDSRFVEGFVTASLTVCIGAMAIVGSIQDGLLGDPSTLFTKSVLDFVIVMVFASAYGKGALFSALPVGVWQGSITVLAALLGGGIPAAAVENLGFMGSVLIFCVGVNLAFGQKFRVANMLPALLIGAVMAVYI